MDRTPRGPTPDDRPAPEAERREDLHTFLFATAAVTTAAAVGAAMQGVWAHESVSVDPRWTQATVRLVASLVSAAVTLLVAVALRLHVPRRPASRVGRVLGIGVIASAVRLCVLAALQGDTWSARLRLFEGVGAMPVVWVGCVVGILAVDAQRRLRDRTAEVARRTHQASAALAALADEELRVRRDVAEGLHGTAQQRLALAVHELGRVASAPDAEVADTWRALVTAVRDDLDDVRGTDIRELSRLLYPAHLELGLVPAVRAVVRLLPTATATRVEVDASVRALDDPAALRTTDAERLLVVRVVEEAVTNAVRHGDAPSLTVRLGTQDGGLVVDVVDDGAGFEPATVTSSGLARLTERLTLAGGSLSVDSAPGAGVRLRAVVPVVALDRNSQLRCPVENDSDEVGEDQDDRAAGHPAACGDRRAARGRRRVPQRAADPPDAPGARPGDRPGHGVPDAERDG